MQKGFSPVLLLVGLLVVGAVLFGSYKFYQSRGAKQAIENYDFPVGGDMVVKSTGIFWEVPEDEIPLIQSVDLKEAFLKTEYPESLVVGTSPVVYKAKLSGDWGIFTTGVRGPNGGLIPDGYIYIGQKVSDEWRLFVDKSSEFCQKFNQSPTDLKTGYQKLVQICTDETANWKTFSDARVGVSFDYPANWNLEPVSQPRQYLWQVVVSDPSYGGLGCRGDCDFFVIYFDNETNYYNLTLDQVIERDFYNATENQVKLSDLKREKKLVKGIEFTKLMGLPGGAYYTLYYLKGDKIYRISSASAPVKSMVPESKTQKNLDITEKLLQTVKILQ